MEHVKFVPHAPVNLTRNHGIAHPYTVENFTDFLADLIHMLQIFVGKSRIIHILQMTSLLRYNFSYMHIAHKKQLGKINTRQMENSSEMIFTIITTGITGTSSKYFKQIWARHRILQTFLVTGNFFPI